MAIKQKRSLVPGSIPTTSSLVVGELAMNIPDGRIFFRKSGSGSDTVQSAITTGAQNSGSVTLTGSLNIFNSSGNTLEISGDTMEFTGSFMVTGSSTITGSLSVTNGITGSLLGTSSWATNALTASSADNFTVRGTLTAQTIVVQVITSSTDFVTGSTRFGTLASNTHVFTGSVSISGSLTVQGAISGSNITGSLLGTASYASNALSASYAVNSGNTISASFSINAGSASYALNAGNAISSSFTTNAGSASYALNAGNTQTASFAINANSASYALNAGNTQTASFAINANSASYALNAGNAQTASFATNAANAFIQNGNSFGVAAVLGTNDSQSLQFETSGSTRVTISGSGNVGIGTLTPTLALLQVQGNVSASSFTGSLLGTAATASFFSGTVTSASYASASTSASFATNAQTASFFSGTVTSASYASASTSASYAFTASFALNGNSSHLHTQSVAATTWSVVHNFQTQFPVVTVYDNTNSVIIPQQISASTTSSLTILFSTPRTGYVAVSKGGYTANVGSASYAFTSSLAILALTASFLSGSVSNATSASYSATSSYSEGFKISQAQYFATSSAISGSSRIISISTSSFDAVFVDYVLSSGSNQRAGTVVGTWNSGSVQFMDNSTLDIGTTSVVTMSVAISASSAVVQTQSPIGWTIKATYRTI